MIFLNFFLTYVIYVDKTNVKNATEQSYQRPVFLLIFSPHCGHCQAVHPHWIKFMKKYEKDNKILIGECNAVEHRSECKSLFQYSGYPTFIIISRGKSKEVSVKRDYDSFIQEAEKMKKIDHSIPCSIYQSEFDHKYPAFILTNDQKSDKKCQIIQKIIEAYPQSKTHLYINESLSTQESFVAHSSTGDFVKYEGPREMGPLVDFMKDFMMAPFGDWNYSDASYSSKRIGLLIHSHHSEYLSFVRIIEPYFKNLSLCKIESSFFENIFPNFTFNSGNLPAFAISNADKTKFILLVNVLRNKKFFSLVYRALNGELEEMAKYDLSELFPVVAANKSDNVLKKKREKIVEIVRENVSKNKKILGRNIDLQSFIQKLKEDNKYWPTRTSVPSRLATTNFKVFLFLVFIFSFITIGGLLYLINNSDNKLE